MAYIVVDVETVPLDREEHLKRAEDERKKLLNPIDSKIIAIGVKTQNAEPVVFMGEDEANLLSSFWQELAKHKSASAKIIGFNIKEFDLPFLVTRSFLNNVEIVPFVIKEIVDIREKLSAYKFGNVRGKLKEFAALLEIETLGMEGSKVAEEYWKGNTKKIRDYLAKDLEITETIYQRIVRLKIDKIERW
ncbi:putative 3'-5' exonuclease related to the exonuclease domain of PolB [uncultured archaeon]|nr:putative 3'-5' exonuclease related to the exonuclease domain of PolB [uncultured archaeon]